MHYRPNIRIEPDLGLRAGDDGLDFALKILRDAPDHLSEHGLLICEVGESERHLVKLLPEVPFAWVEFKVGQMGIFVIDRNDILAHHERIKHRWRMRDKGKLCRITGSENYFSVTTFGESHGPAIGCVIDGCPPGIAISAEGFQRLICRAVQPASPDILRSAMKTMQ